MMADRFSDLSRASVRLSSPKSGSNEPVQVFELDVPKFGTDLSSLWVVFVGGIRNGIVFRYPRILGSEFSFYPTRSRPHEEHYRQVDILYSPSLGDVAVFSLDGKPVPSGRVWIKNEGAGEGLVLVLDGEDDESI